MGKMGELVRHCGWWVVSMTACGYKFSASEWLQPAAAGQMIDSQDWCITLAGQWTRLTAHTLSELLWRTSYWVRQSFLLSHILTRALRRFCPGTGHITVVVSSGSDTRQNKSFDATCEQNQNHFIWSYFRPRRPLLRPHLVAVAEATWKKKYKKNRQGQLHATLEAVYNIIRKQHVYCCQTLSLLIFKKYDC